MKELLDLMPDAVKDAPWVAELLKNANPQKNVIPERKKFRRPKKKPKNIKLIRPGLDPAKRRSVGVSVTQQTVGDTPLVGYNEAKKKKKKLIIHKPPRAVHAMGEPMRYWMGVGAGQRSQWGDYNQAQNSDAALVEQGHWVTIDGKHVLIGQAGSEPYQRTKDEFTGPYPVTMDDMKGGKELSNEQMAAMDAHRDRRRAWELSINQAVSEGKLTPKEAIKRGMFESDAQEFKPLPDTLYHVTVAADQVDAEGLKSRDERGIRTGGEGLGGGTSDTISLTTDPKIAQGIYDGIKEAHAVVNGKLTVAEMLSQAENGVGASHPYDSELVKHQEGSYGTMDRLLRGVTTDGSTFAIHKLPSEMPGWTHVGEPLKGGDGQIRYSQWERPMSSDEKQSAAFNFYRAWSLFRESAGGKYDAFFGFNDVKALAAVKPENIAIYKATPVPGAMGKPPGGEAEYRIYTGRAVKISRVKGNKL